MDRSSLIYHHKREGRPFDYESFRKAYGKQREAQGYSP